MAEFASNGKGNLGVTLGAVGTGLALLNGGAGLFGAGVAASNNGNNGWNNNGCCSENQPVSRYELGMSERINQLQSEKDALQSDQKTDGKILELYRYVEQQFTQDRGNVNARFTVTGETIANLAANQAVINQRVTDNLNFVDSNIANQAAYFSQQIAAVYKEIECKTLPLEKKISATSMCPQPMPLLNSWTAPTATTPTTAASVSAK